MPCTSHCLGQRFSIPVWEFYIKQKGSRVKELKKFALDYKEGLGKFV